MIKLKDAVAGDIGDHRIIVLDGVADLDAVTAIEAHVWRLNGPATTLAATVVDSATCTIRVELGDATGWLATASPGSWSIEYQLAFGTTVLTWPNGSPDTLQVRAQGG